MSRRVRGEAEAMPKRVLAEATRDDGSPRSRRRRGRFDAEAMRGEAFAKGGGEAKFEAEAWTGRGRGETVARSRLGRVEAASRPRRGRVEPESKSRLVRRKAEVRPGQSRPGHSRPRIGIRGDAEARSWPWRGEAVP